METDRTPIIEPISASELDSNFILIPKPQPLIPSMSLWKVAWRSIRQRALVSTLTVVSMGLGVALVVAVLVVYGVVYQSFHRGGEGYDLIVGAKGGREQLVLNTVFYLSQPIGNIPYSFYEELTEGKYAADVETAIPVCMGHTYQGFRVVGTVPEMFTDLKYRGNQSYEFAAGENFKAAKPFDAVVGAIAAAKAGLTVGEKFQAVHGSSEGGRVHKETFRVVGVLAPTEHAGRSGHLRQHAGLLRHPSCGRGSAPHAKAKNT